MTQSLVIGIRPLALGDYSLNGVMVGWTAFRILDDAARDNNDRGFQCVIWRDGMSRCSFLDSLVD